MNKHDVIPDNYTLGPEGERSREKDRIWGFQL